MYKLIIEYVDQSNNSLEGGINKLMKKMDLAWEGIAREIILTTDTRPTEVYIESLKKHLEEHGYKYVNIKVL
jgi:hypothetical protein